MAKFLKISGFTFLILLIIINFLVVLIILIPSHYGLSFAMERNSIKVSDLPAHISETFLFLKDSQKILYVIPISDDTTRRWMAKVLTVREQKWSDPREHFDFYLNTLNFGDGVIGIEEAAKYYFNKTSYELTESEAQMLATLYQSFANL